MSKLFIIFGGVAATFAAVLAVRRYSSRAQRAYRAATGTDILDFLDLNDASHAELSGIGLTDALIERVVENRPYRNKLDLISRLVIPEDAYEAIRTRIGVRQAEEPVKVA
ncbi:MAG TPA: hypothetical protein VFI95_02455 [Terriglobales bacterium]|nr:hypothetical protein [Terriglobales bacterium]